MVAEVGRARATGIRILARAGSPSPDRLSAPWAKSVTWPLASPANTKKDLQASDEETRVWQKPVGLQKVRPALLAPQLRLAQRGPGPHGRALGRTLPPTAQDWAPTAPDSRLQEHMGPVFSHFLSGSNACPVPLASSSDADSLGQAVFLLEIVTTFLFSR